MDRITFELTRAAHDAWAKRKLSGAALDEQLGCMETAMDVAKEIAGLEQRVAMLLEHADKMRAHIAAHEFSLAADEASALALYCGGANTWANRITDAT